MALPMPQFQVGAISPSAYQNRYNDFGDRLIAQAMGYAIDSRLAEQRAALDLANNKALATHNSYLDTEEAFAQGLMTGSLVPRPKDSFYLPGEEPISPIKGIGRYGKQEFVPGSAVASLLHERYLNSPVEALGDRPALPGTRVRDTINSEGEPLPIEQLDRFRLGDPVGVAEQIENMPGGTSTPVGRGLASRLQSFTSDGHLTVEEEKNITAELSTERNRELYSTLFTMENTSQDRAAAIAQQRRQINSTVQVWDPDTQSRRDLTPYELNLLTAYESTETNALSEDLIGQARWLQEHAIPRIGAPDNRQQLADMVINSGIAEHQFHDNFANWLQGQYNGAPDSIKERIRADLAADGITTMGYNAFREFAMSANSTGYRQYWALYNTGYSNADDISRLTRELTTPFGLAGVWRVGEILNPAGFNPSGIVAPAGGGLPSLVPTPSPAARDATYSQAIEVIEEMGNLFQGSSVRATDIRSALNSNDPAVIRDNLTAIRDGLKETGSELDSVVADALDDMLSSFSNAHTLRVFQEAFFNSFPTIPPGNR